MANIGNAPGRAFYPCRGTIGVWRWCPNRPLRLGGAPPTVYVPTEQVAPASWRYPLWVEKTLAVEVIGFWAIVIARHGARIILPAAPATPQSLLHSLRWPAFRWGRRSTWQRSLNAHRWLAHMETQTASVPQPDCRRSANRKRCRFSWIGLPRLVRSCLFR
jgi:hypothetical protein